MADDKPNAPIKADGQDFGPLFEPSNFFEYNSYGNEKIFDGPNNSFIVLGRDRMGLDGYGGDKAGRCGSIDLVAGRMSTFNAIEYKEKSSKVNPSPVNDAARLYLSQKSDIDKLFYCPKGKSGISQSGNSAAVLKADDIRIIGRNTIKIISRPDDYLSKLGPNNAKILASEKYGVELIADAKSNETELQPMTKGTNLKEFLESIVLRIKETNAILADFIEIQCRINNTITNHTHISAYPGSPTLISGDLLSSLIPENKQLYLRINAGIKKCSVNLVSSVVKYLTAGKSTYINSEYHHLN